MSVEKARLNVLRYSTIEFAAISPVGEADRHPDRVARRQALLLEGRAGVSPICASVHGVLLSIAPAKQETCVTSGVL